MAYVDYSTHWVLDAFLTYLEANVLGSNDEHLYDTFAVEHNINTSTVDGTHKTNSITGGMINTTPVSTGSQYLDFGLTWTPTVGVYQITATSTAPTSNAKLKLELYISGAWRSLDAEDGSIITGLLFFDGTNMRLANVGLVYSFTVWYQKF